MKQKNSFFWALFLCVSGLIISGGCNKEIKQTETREQAIERVSQTFTSDATFQEIIKNRVIINFLLMKTARQGSVLFAENQSDHPFIKLLSEAPDSDASNLRRLMLTQFAAGDTIVDYIYNVIKLESKLEQDFPELTDFSESELDLVYEKARPAVIGKLDFKNTPVSSAAFTGCLGDFVDDLLNCATLLGAAAKGCTKIRSPKLMAICLIIVAGGSGGCVGSAIAAYIDCDPAAPSAP